MAATPEEVAQQSPDVVTELPRTLRAKLGWVGPSFAVAAAAVGSGEIIQATRLGALGGLSVLWVVFWGVLLKGFIQQEIGRFTVISGTEINVGFGNVPGPRLRGQSWFLWLILLLLALPILIIIAGIGGAIGGVLSIFAPGLGATAWGTIGMLTIVPLLLVGTFFGGRIRVYQYFEVIMLTLVIVMTVVMLYLAFVGIPLGQEEFRYSFGDLAAGMAFQLPEGTLLSALAVLGGVGAGIELLFYSPWLAAKGYARHAHARGPEGDRDERLATWLSVTKLDTWLGVLATLLISVAYFVTGGSILAALGVVPDGVNVVETVSNVVTTTLGEPFYYAFLVAALAGLYSTALGIADGTARLLNSVNDQMSTTPRTEKDRKVLYRWAVCLVVLSWVVFYALVEAPTLLITLGQAILSLLFPLYAVALVYLDRSLPARFRMSLPVKAALVFCFLLFTSVWVYAAFQA